MDGLDASILRSMFPSGKWSILGVDPLLSPGEIGQRVGLSANTVRRRIARWRSDGFLRAYAAVPNPRLLGLDLQLQLLSVEGLSGCEAFERELGLLETPALVYRLGTSYAVFALSPGVHTAARDRERIRRFPQLRVVSQPIPIDLPPPARPMRSADWRLLAALRAEPAAVPRLLCLREGGSARSCHRRLASWRDGHLVFFQPLLDFEHARGTVAWMGAVVERAAESEVIERGLESAFPERIPIQSLFPIDRLLSPRAASGGSEAVQFFLPAPTAQAAEAAFSRFCRLPGLRNATLAFPTRNYSLSSVIDDAIAEELSRIRSSEERRMLERSVSAPSGGVRIPSPIYPVAGVPAEFVSEAVARAATEAVFYRRARGAAPRREREPN